MAGRRTLPGLRTTWWGDAHHDRHDRPPAAPSARQSDVQRANLDAEITYSTDDSPSKPIPSKGGRKKLQRAARPNVPKTFGSRAR